MGEIYVRLDFGSGDFLFRGGLRMRVYRRWGRITRKRIEAVWSIDSSQV